MPTDIILNDNLDLKTRNGDFEVSESTLQHQKLLLLAQKGEWREYPRVGIGIQNYIEDDALGDLYQEIQKQYTRDGMQIDKLRVLQDGKIDVEAEYE